MGGTRAEIAVLAGAGGSRRGTPDLGPLLLPVAELLRGVGEGRRLQGGLRRGRRDVFKE